MKKVKGTKNGVLLMLFISIAVMFLTAIFPVVYAYFTATATRTGTITFGSIGVNLLGSDGDVLQASDLKTNYLTNILPGQTLNLNDITVENLGNIDEYVLINVDISIAKTGATTLTYNNWYNVEGIQVNVNDFAINSAEATLIEKETSQTANIAWIFPGNALSNDYQGATATVTVGAYGVQTVLPEAEAYVSEPLYASYFICREANDIQGINQKNLFNNHAEPARASQVAVEPLDNGIKVISTATSSSSYLNLYYTLGELADFVGKTITWSLTNNNSTQSGLSVYIVKNTDDKWNSRTIIKSKSITYNSSGSLTATIEADDSMAYLGIHIHLGTNAVGKEYSLLNMQIEYGPTATEYEPYKVNQSHAEITTEPLMKLATAEDSYDSSTQTVMRNVKKLELTGNESWGIYSASIGGLYYLNIDDAKYSTNILCLCSHYEGQLSGSASSYGTGNAWLQSTSTYPRFYIYDENYILVEEFKAYLQNEYNAGHPVTIWYQLADGKQTTQKAFPSKNLYEGSQFLHYETGASDNNVNKAGCLHIAYEEEKNLTATTPELGDDLFNYIQDKTITISCKVKRYEDDTAVNPRLTVVYRSSASSTTNLKHVQSFYNKIPADGKWQYVWITLPAISSLTQASEIKSVTIWLMDYTEAPSRHFEIKDLQIEVGSSPTDFEMNTDTYSFYDYIQSSGTQYINTGFVANQDTRVVADFQLTASTASFVFGTRASYISNMFTFNMGGGTPYSFLSGYGDSGNTTIQKPIDLNRHIVDKNKNKLYFDGVLNTTYDEGEFTCPGTLNIFASYDASKSGNGYLPCKMRLYNFAIYNDGTMVRNFIPVVRKSDGEVGLLDIVNATFYENQGTGDFVAGHIS